jgi:hypothetical protein
VQFSLSHSECTTNCTGDPVFFVVLLMVGCVPLLPGTAGTEGTQWIGRVPEEHKVGKRNVQFVRHPPHGPLPADHLFFVTSKNGGTTEVSSQSNLLTQMQQRSLPKFNRSPISHTNRSRTSEKTYNVGEEMAADTAACGQCGKSLLFRLVFLSPKS